MLVSIWPGRATRPDESKASDSHARSSQIWYEKRLLACPIESDLVRKRPQNILRSTGAGWIFEDFLSFDFFSVLHVSLFFFSLIMPTAVLVNPCRKRNRYSHSTLSVRVFRWKRTYGGSTSPLRCISRSISAVSSWSTAKVKRNISSWTFNSSW